MVNLAPCHQRIPTVYPAVLAATLRRVGLNASATNRAVAALQALPTALDSVASSVQGGIDVLNNTVQQASLPAQPREEAQKNPKLTVDRKARLIVFGLCRGGSFENATLPGLPPSAALLLQTVSDIRADWEETTMSIQDTWRFIPIAGKSLQNQHLTASAPVSERFRPQRTLADELAKLGRLPRLHS